jgi:sirohydrochlorin ferrochelatase
MAGALLAAVLTAAPAAAADPTPAPDPLSPTAYSPSVSPPSQQQIDDAKEALKRLRNQGKATPTTVTQVAAPTSATADRNHAIRLRISDQGWWVVGAGLLVLLVASETTRVSVRRAKHRKQA